MRQREADTAGDRFWAHRSPTIEHPDRADSDTENTDHPSRDCEWPVVHTESGSANRRASERNREPNEPDPKA